MKVAPPSAAEFLRMALTGRAKLASLTHPIQPSIENDRGKISSNFIVSRFCRSISGWTSNRTDAAGLIAHSHMFTLIVNWSSSLRTACVEFLVVAKFPGNPEII